MPLLKHGKFVDNSWVFVADDQDVPADGLLLVSPARWLSDRDALVAREGVGLLLNGDDNPEIVSADLHRFSTIALDFPTFMDGRSYSNARLLRDQYGYTGELRAVGEVLRDQYAFMLSCGFDAFDVPNGDTAEDWRKSASAIRVSYQGGLARGAAAMHLRHGEAAGA